MPGIPRSSSLRSHPSRCPRPAVPRCLRSGQCQEWSSCFLARESGGSGAPATRIVRGRQRGAIPVTATGLRSRVSTSSASFVVGHLVNRRDGSAPPSLVLVGARRSSRCSQARAWSRSPVIAVRRLQGLEFPVFPANHAATVIAFAKTGHPEVRQRRACRIVIGQLFSSVNVATRDQG